MGKEMFNNVVKEKQNKSTKMNARVTKKICGVILASVILVHLEKCGAQLASCGHVKNVVHRLQVVVT
jgi:hypothetical protein